MRVKVLSPARPLADVEATSVSVPGTLGFMEILPNHAPMVAEVDVGPLRIKKSDGELLSYFVSGGYVDVSRNEIKVLVDVAVPPHPQSGINFCYALYLRPDSRSLIIWRLFFWNYSRSVHSSMQPTF